MRRLCMLFSLCLLLAACGEQTQVIDAPPAATTLPLGAGNDATPAPTVFALPSDGSAAPAQLPADGVPPTPTAVTNPAPTTSPADDQGGGPRTIVPPADDISLPDGFGISVYQGKLKGPRMLTVGPDGMIYVAERAADRIVRLPDADNDGVSDEIQVVAAGLNAPSSMAFYTDGSLYVGETTQIVRLSNPDGNGVFQQRDVIIDGLPDGGHSTRTVLFSPDYSKLYVSIGSSCNVCNEDDERRAAIMVYNPDGSDGQLYAKGLRNAVGLALQPGTDIIWASNNGRDMLGDDLPPETVNVVNQPGLDFGWPRCHAGRIADPEYGGADACANVAAPAVEIQAHSAPLGLAFGAATNFPEPYRSGLFVALHGSWNRTVPTGYKVVFVALNDGVAGTVQDFAAGWLKADGTVWGRPVDVLPGPDGDLYISDDAGGIIYRVFAMP